ncbi:MAG: hypothetical protein IJX78_01660 [Bacilli bacterium]|nr:hypothetical protein [Bacilli bacterium]
MKVLVSAFKPFYKSVNNYSSEVLEYITGVDKVILDVVYDECYKELSSKYNLSEFDLIIALGEARSRKILTLEVEAKNIASCSIADNAGIIKKDEKIINEALEVLSTKVNLDNVKNYVELSYDAGKFVCNNIYFHLLYNYPTKSLFIHIPECHNDVKMYQEYAGVINKIILDLESVL